MKKDHFDLLNSCFSLFEFKTVFDNEGNEYVLNASNKTDEITDIEDKTAFEALQNHFHIFDNIRADQKKDIINFSNKFGKALIDILAKNYPSKHFVVFISVDTTMIVRFHQKWKNEPWYYMLNNDYEGTTILCFDN